MSPIEIRRVGEYVKGMREEEIVVALEYVPMNLLTNEIFRRDAEKETIISGIKETLNKERSING